MKVIKMIARGIGILVGSLIAIVGVVGLYLNSGETFEDVGANKVILEAVPSGDPLVGLICFAVAAIGALLALYLIPISTEPS